MDHELSVMVFYLPRGAGTAHDAEPPLDTVSIDRTRARGRYVRARRRARAAGRIRRHQGLLGVIRTCLGLG
jgi:hypothetical protein